jgi:hypothetical protein
MTSELKTLEALQEENSELRSVLANILDAYFWEDRGALRKHLKQGQKILRSSKTVVPWPAEWPWFKQTFYADFRNRCDVLVGQCSCGAWHTEGEFELRDGYLYRYGNLVPSENVTSCKITETTH